MGHRITVLSKTKIHISKVFGHFGDMKVFCVFHLFLNSISDELRFCCVAKHVKECLPEADEFSSCEDLMRNTFLRFNLWVVGLVATFCNAIVIVTRSGKRRDSRVSVVVLQKKN